MLYISDVIRKIMIDRGVSVTTLSKKIGVATSNLSRKLQNKNEDYKISYLQDVARALNCDISINFIDSDTKKVLYTLED